MTDQRNAENPSLYRAAREAAAAALPAAICDWAEPVTLAVLRVALPMHETQHADTLRLAAEAATHFELEAMRRAEERDAATIRAVQAETERDEIRARLAEIGETAVEWGVRGGGGTFRVDDEAAARWHAFGPAEPMTVVRRAIGEWREAEEGSKRG